jgi:MSHA pilin protein MshC
MTIVTKKCCAGFTLFELLIVIVLLSILSVFALGSLFDQDEFAARGFFDDTVNAVRFAQKLAISTGCEVQVAISAAGYQLSQKGPLGGPPDCITGGFIPVKNPANRGKNYSNLSSGFSLSPVTSITFDARGIPLSGSDATITLSGTSYSFEIDGQTGLVW